MMFEVRNTCPKSKPNPRLESAQSHPELFPFRVRVTHSDDPDKCRQCGAQTYLISGTSLRKVEQAFGIEHDPERDRYVCASMGVEA